MQVNQVSRGDAGPGLGLANMLFHSLYSWSLIIFANSAPPLQVSQMILVEIYTLSLLVAEETKTDAFSCSYLGPFMPHGQLWVLVINPFPGSSRFPPFF